MKILGICHCYAVRYEVKSDGSYPFQKCYCSICQKTSGRQRYSINLSADAQMLRIDGEEHAETYRALLSPDARQSNYHRRFCRRCGNHLWAWNSTWPEFLHPVASSVDSDLPKSPYYTHIMRNYKPDWVETSATPKDLCFVKYPDESIAEWHQRLANT